MQSSMCDYNHTILSVFPFKLFQLNCLDSAQFHECYSKYHNIEVSRKFLKHMRVKSKILDPNYVYAKTLLSLLHVEFM